MLNANLIIRMIFDAQRDLGLNNIEFAKKANVSTDRWEDLRKGKGRLNLDELPKLAKAVGLSFQIVAPYHEPLMELSEEETAGLQRLAEHYMKNGPQQPHPLRSAVEKLIGN